MPANADSSRLTKPSKDSGAALQGCGLATLCTQHKVVRFLEQLMWGQTAEDLQGMRKYCIDDEGEPAAILFTCLHDL